MYPKILRRTSGVILSSRNIYRQFSSKGNFDINAFVDNFLRETKELPHATDPSKSSRALRHLVKSKKLMFTDMENCPEKFFLAHRLLSSIGLGGFGVRFTGKYRNADTRVIWPC
jgi:hypothetical protein